MESRPARPMTEPGTLYRAERKRTVRSLSTVRVSTAPDGRTHRGQRAQQRPLDSRRSIGHGPGLAVEPGVDLGAPGRCRGVRRRRSSPKGPRPDEQVGLGIAHEVLDDPLRFGVPGLAEVEPEAIVGGEGDIARCRHHDVGHDPALETAHAVGEQDAGHPAEQLEALGQQRQRRGLVLSLGEAHEAPAAPGEHGTEDLQPVLLTPVEDEVLTGHGLPGSIRATLPSMLGLGLGHGATEAAGRAGIALGPAQRQQALGADAAIGGFTFAAMSSRTGSVSLGLAGRSAAGRARRSTTRRTVLWVVPQSAAVAR